MLRFLQHKEGFITFLGGKIDASLNGEVLEVLHNVGTTQDLQFEKMVKISNFGVAIGNYGFTLDNNGNVDKNDPANVLAFRIKGDMLNFNNAHFNNCSLAVDDDNNTYFSSNVNNNQETYIRKLQPATPLGVYCADSDGLLTQIVPPANLGVYNFSKNDNVLQWNKTPQVFALPECEWVSLTSSPATFTLPTQKRCCSSKLGRTEFPGFFIKRFSFSNS